MFKWFKKEEKEEKEEQTPKMEPKPEPIHVARFKLMRLGVKVTQSTLYTQEYGPCLYAYLPEVNPFRVQMNAFDVEMWIEKNHPTVRFNLTQDQETGHWMLSHTYLPDSEVGDPHQFVLSMQDRHGHYVLGSFPSRYDAEQEAIREHGSEIKAGEVICIITDLTPKDDEKLQSWDVLELMEKKDVIPA